MLILQASVLLHVVSWVSQVVPVLPWAKTKQWAGKFCDWLTIPKHFLLTLSFVLSDFLVVCRGEITTNHFKWGKTDILS